MQAEANIDYSPDPKSKYAQLLEKKWTSVIRLQKKVGPPLSSVHRADAKYWRIFAVCAA